MAIDEEARDKTTRANHTSAQKTVAVSKKLLCVATEVTESRYVQKKYWTPLINLQGKGKMNIASPDFKFRTL